MLGKDRMREIADRILETSGADQTEVLLTHNTEGLTRFAANEIHQNVSAGPAGQTSGRVVLAGGITRKKAAYQPEILAGAGAQVGAVTRL